MSHRPGLLIIPEQLFLYPGLTPAVLKTLLVLMSFAWGSKKLCWPSVAVLAKVAGFSERTIIRHLAILVKQGWIERQERFGHTTLYTIVPKKFSPNLRASMDVAMKTLHPMLRRRTTNKEWQVLIKHDRLLGRKS